MFVVNIEIATNTNGSRGMIREDIMNRLSYSVEHCHHLKGWEMVKTKDIRYAIIFLPVLINLQTWKDLIHMKIMKEINNKYLELYEIMN